MDPPRPRPDPDGELRDLFAGTAPAPSPADLDALFARADARRAGRHSRRLAMTIRIAAAATLAAMTAVAFFGRETSAAFDLDEVQRRVNGTQTVTLTQVSLVNGKPRDSAKLLVSGPDLVRAEFDGGYSVSDFRSKKVVIVHPGRKHATVLEGTAFRVPEGTNFYTLFRDLARNPTKTLPGREVDGKPAVGFLVVLDGKEATVWVDRESRLPVRVEQSSREGNDVYEHVMSDIVFDRPLDPALFRLDAPEGYEVEARGVAQLAPVPEDPSLAAPTITPLVGLGPARFGMTRDEVVRALGKPDREFEQGRVTFLAYYSRGFELWLLPASHPRHGLHHASCFGQHGFSIQVREFRGKTDKGLGLGATRAEIVAAYGPPDHEIASRMKDVRKDAPNPEEPTGQTQVYYNKLGLSFTLYNDRTYQIWIDSPRPGPAAKK